MACYGPESKMDQIPPSGSLDRLIARLGDRDRTRFILSRHLAALSGGPDWKPAGTPDVDKKAARSFFRFSGRILKMAGIAVLVFHLWFIFTTSVLLLLYRRVDPPVTVIMPYRRLLYGWKLEAPRPVPLKTIPVYIRSMLIGVEDGKFYSHHGLDFEAFKRARKINAIVGRPLYGGSTLTMQLARTLFLVPEKSYIRKYLEIIVALEMEAILSKDRILELYFGYAEWGKGIFGIEAASRKYYKLPVNSLDRDQAARLVTLLSSPIKYTPATLSKSGILRERYAYLSRRFKRGDRVVPDALPPMPIPPGALEPGVQEPEESTPSPEDTDPGPDSLSSQADSSGLSENTAAGNGMSPEPDAGSAVAVPQENALPSPEASPQLPGQP